MIPTTMKLTGLDSITRWTREAREIREALARGEENVPNASMGPLKAAWAYRAIDALRREAFGEGVEVTDAQHQSIRRAMHAAAAEYAYAALADGRRHQTIADLALAVHLADEFLVQHDGSGYSFTEMRALRQEALDALNECVTGIPA